MTNAKRERIERALNDVRADLERLDAKMDKAEAAGDREKYARLDRRQDMMLERFSGMQKVLAILGYCVQQGRDGEPWKLIDNY